MLLVAGGAGAFAGYVVVRSQQVQQVRLAQARGVIRQALLVDQKRKGDPGFFPEEARIIAVAQADGRQVGAQSLKFLFAFAQLRGVLAAEDSTVMAQENDDRGLPLPQGAQTSLAPAGIRQRDRREALREHTKSVLLK